MNICISGWTFGEASLSVLGYLGISQFKNINIRDAQAHSNWSTQKLPFHCGIHDCPKVRFWVWKRHLGMGRNTKVVPLQWIELYSTVVIEEKYCLPRAAAVLWTIQTCQTHCNYYNLFKYIHIYVCMYVFMYLNELQYIYSSMAIIAVKKYEAYAHNGITFKWNRKEKKSSEKK